MKLLSATIYNPTVIVLTAVIIINPFFPTAGHGFQNERGPYYVP